MKTQICFVFLLLIALFSFVGCFPQNSGNMNEIPSGFFMGIWHGWIAPLSLIVSIFNHSVRIYEIHNTGWWYDLGFYMAIISGFGGLALSRKQNDEKS